MSKSKITNLPKQTVEIEITIPWSDIKTTYDQVLDSVTRESEIQGFRKGKAPKKLIEEKIDKTKIYEEVVKKIVPKSYADAVREHQLMPVVSPRIDIVNAKNETDWVIKATIALKPKINLRNYKEKIAELKKSKVKLWTPGQDKDKKEEKPSLDEIVQALLAVAEVELSDELVTNEANRLLSDLVDQTRQVGLTVEQYLISKGKTNEQLRSEYAQTARKNLSVEFILMEIADSEKITVSKEDIDALVNKIKDPGERERLSKDTYYLAHLIRQQKTIDFLSNL